MKVAKHNPHQSLFTDKTKNIRWRLFAKQGFNTFCLIDNLDASNASILQRNMNNMAHKLEVTLGLTQGVKRCKFIVKPYKIQSNESK